MADTKEKNTEEVIIKQAAPSLMDIFVRGARKGWDVAIDNIIPNVLNSVKNFVKLGYNGVKNLIPVKDL